MDSSSGDLGRGDVASRNFWRWTLPDGAYPRQLVRLDLATGVFTAWATPGQPVFALAADAAGGVYFHEVDGDLRRVGRLVPATGQLTEWNFDPPNVEFTGEMALEAGRLFFAISNPAGMVVALDPTVAGDESIIAPFVADPVTPSTAVISPVLTRRARSRTGRVHPVVSAPPAAALGAAFTTWDTGPVVLGNGNGAGTMYGAADLGGPAIARFVP